MQRPDRGASGHGTWLPAAQTTGRGGGLQALPLGRRLSQEHMHFLGGGV